MGYERDAPIDLLFAARTGCRLDSANLNQLGGVWVVETGHMRVQLLYFPGCPNWKKMDDLLREAMFVLHNPATIEYIELMSDEVAMRLEFIGSPSVRIDGVDLFSTLSKREFGLSCRVYSTPEGMSGVPTLEQISDALKIMM